MVQVTLDNLVPNTLPTDGWKVEYRIKGTTGSYIVPVDSPYTAFPIIFTTTDPAGTLYEGHIWRDCGALESTKYDWVTPCACTTSGYAPAPSGVKCNKTDVVAPTVTQECICLARSTFNVYTAYGSRIYNPGFDVTTLFLPFATSDANIYGTMTSSPMWANPSSGFVGPMNRRGVWIDTDCDGNKDPLSSGSHTTISFSYNNPTDDNMDIFIGVSADNQFKVVINGAIIVDTGTVFSDIQFKIYHLIPATLVPGANFINIVATGDGTTNDSMAAAGYNNTAAELHDPLVTSDGDLSIIFDSNNLVGTPYSVSTCPSGYSLDTSDGCHSYHCTRTLVKPCNTAI